MSAAEQSLKAKMAMLKAKKEAAAAAAAAAAGGGAVAPAAGALTRPAAVQPARPSAAVSMKRETPAAVQRPSAAAPKPSTAATATSARALPKPANSSATKPAAGKAESPSISKVAPATNSTSSAPTAAPRRRLQKTADLLSNSSERAASSASAAVAPSVKPVKPVPAAAAASPAPTSATQSRPAAALPKAIETAKPAASTTGLKRKKPTSGPTQPVELVLKDDSGVKKPRVSFLTNTDHLASNARNEQILRDQQAAAAALAAGNASGAHLMLRRASPEEKCTLFVWGLAAGVVASRDLAPVFAPYGHVEEWKVGEGRSYGTLRFRTRDAASMALEQLHDSVACGCTLQLEWYLPRERGTLPPMSPAFTAQTDLDKYFELPREATGFQQMLMQWKPHLADKAELQAPPPPSAVHVRPYTPLGGSGGMLTRSGAKALADASTPPMPQLPPVPTEFPQRDIVTYDGVECK